MKKTFSLLVSVLVVAVILIGCGGGGGGSTASNNANLSALTVSEGTLSPAFAPDTTSYTDEVASGVASITVTPTAAESHASITVNGTAGSSGSASGDIALSTGANTITVVVTAEDGATTKTYTITATKLAEPSHNADLAGLTISQGTLSPAFSRNTTDYSAEVPSSTVAVTVTPTAGDVNASITVNGTAVASGTASGNIALSIGVNTITIVVTAEDGLTTKTYTVTLRVVINLPKTGQTTCYDADATIISCATTTGQGQDGALQSGVAWPDPRFTAASSSAGIVVTDNLTGLMWAGDGGTPTFAGTTSTCTGGVLTWQDALNYVACLNTNNYLGHTDWRLPNQKELRSLANYGQTDSAAWLNTQGFSNAQASLYWSSSTYAASASFAWNVVMFFGSVPAYPKNSSYNVWPVRSGQGAHAPADIPRTGQVTSYDTNTVQRDDGALQRGVAWPNPRFTVASSGAGAVVTDNLTGLMWAGDSTLIAGCSSATTTTWQGALNYVACLNTNSYLGHNDWRLPNVNELESLVHAEYTKETTCGGPCTSNDAWLNTQGFSNVQADRYWSSSSWAANGTAALYINMDYGGVGASDKTSIFYYVWPVRSGQ